MIDRPILRVVNISSLPVDIPALAAASKTKQLARLNQLHSTTSVRLLKALNDVPDFLKGPSTVNAGCTDFAILLDTDGTRAGHPIVKNRIY